MTEPVWELKNVTLDGHPRPRLRDVSATIYPGRTAVMGYSGAGKTSLLNLLVNFESPSNGSVERGFLAVGDTLDLYWVPQDGGLWPHLTVLEHLEAVADGSTNAGALVEKFHLDALLKARPNRLSLGEQNRLSVARSLASCPRVLVMDEPFAHVDPVRVADYWNCVRKYCDDSSASLVFSSHDPNQVLREAERVICLDSGCVVFAGTVQTLFENPPAESIGRFMGPLNWFEPDEALEWLDSDTATAIALRPHRLELRQDEDSPFLVESMRSNVGAAEVLLLSQTTGRRRMFHCRVANGVIADSRVRIDWS